MDLPVPLNVLDRRQTVEESIQTDDIKTEYFIKEEDDFSSDDTSNKSESNFKTIESLTLKSEGDESEFEELISEEKRDAFEVMVSGGAAGGHPGGTASSPSSAPASAPAPAPAFSFASLWEDGSRRSAFLPYKSGGTVLTNLQRGNTQTRTPQSELGGFSWFEKAARGDLTAKDLDKVEDINEVDENGVGGLLWAAAYGQSSVVELLLERGADVHGRGERLESALHLAAAGGHTHVIRHLIAFGAEPHIYDEDGNTPLMYAVHGDHPHAVQELLLEGASIFQPDCFSYAVLKGSLQAQLVMENHILGLFGGESDSS